MTRWIFRAAMLFAAVTSATAHETDHFTVPTGRTFADMGRELTAHVVLNIERAVEKTNRRIAEARSDGDADDVAELQSPDTIAVALLREFPGPVGYIEQLNRLSRSPETQERYPGQIVGWLPSPCVYDGAYLPLDIRQVFVLWRSPLLMVDGVYAGTDKLGHIVHIGYEYFRTYREALREGRSEEDALSEAVQVGINASFLLSEEGLRGGFASGVLSNADLAANYFGLLFYRNLTEPVTLRKRRQPPMLELRDGLWQVAEHVHPDSDFFTRLFDRHLDEALNPNLYDPIMSRTIAAAIEPRAPALLAWYRDANGAPRPRSWYQRQLVELSTYYGVDYGHMTGPGTPVGLASVCFRNMDTERDAAARLHLAADGGDVEAARALLDAGAFVDLPAAAVTSLLEQGATPLHCAAAAGQVPVARLLIERGAKVKARTERDVTPLHRAVECPELVRLLLSHGADPDAPDQQGRTPLHWAARAGAAESVAALLEAGADVHAIDVDRRTALHEAAGVGATGAARLLLDHGANPDAAARYGRRPLHAAAARGDTAMAVVLLEHGADTMAQDAFGVTAAQAAARGRHESLADRLRAGRRPSAPSSEKETLARSPEPAQQRIETMNIISVQGNAQ